MPQIGEVFNARGVAMNGKGVLFLFLACIMATFFSSASCADVMSVQVSLSEGEIREEISLINQRIKELQDRKRSYESRASSAGKTGNRLQYVDFLTARMYFVQQERLTAQAHEAQREVEALMHKKEELEKLVH